MSEATRFQESRDAQQLADALRTRHTARREQPDDDELSADLQRLGDIESIPAVARPGVTAGPMKAARSVLRVLLRPWLAVQTQTNREVARRLQRVSSHVSHLLRRTPEMEESLQHLDARLRAIERRGVVSVASPAIEPGLADVERMFVHMHLGRPPARVLILGAAASLFDEIAAFGFDAANASAPGDLFDVVIALPDSGGGQDDLDEVAREAAQLLPPGGMLLGAWRDTALSVAPPTDAPPAGATASWRSWFEPRVVSTAERGERGWTVREQGSAQTDARAAVHPRANVMIQALRRDAPGR
jgi:hypothetical protein